MNFLLDLLLVVAVFGIPTALFTVYVWHKDCKRAGNTFLFGNGTESYLMEAMAAKELKP